jgi:hypothetical protein
VGAVVKQEVFQLLDAGEGACFSETQLVPFPDESFSYTAWRSLSTGLIGPPKVPT